MPKVISVQNGPTKFDLMWAFFAPVKENVACITLKTPNQGNGAITSEVLSLSRISEHTWNFVMELKDIFGLSENEGGEYILILFKYSTSTRKGEGVFLPAEMYTSRYEDVFDRTAYLTD